MELRMNKRISFWYLPVLLLIALAVNSCKKTDQSNIPNLLTTRQWELGSLLVFHYIGDAQQPTDTITCDTTQIFRFFKDGACTYTNFNCAEPIATGSYSLSSTKVVLLADLTFRDTTLTGTARPFANAQISNLGDFSMVLETGDTQAYYTSNQPRTIYRWGFIRQKEVSIQ
jgi:hypothetical protein